MPTVIFTGATYFAFRAGGIAEQPAIIVAATVCVGVLLWRILQWDEHGRPVSFTEHTRYVDDGPPVLRPIVGSSDAQRLIIGRFEFTETEWQRLGRVLASGKVTRAALADLQRDDGAPLFSSLTERYPSIVEELQRVGWIDDNNETTDAALAWFSDHGIALPRDGR